MKCPNCGADAYLVNPWHKIWCCTESGIIWEKKPCMYGCFIPNNSSTQSKINGDEQNDSNTI